MKIKFKSIAVTLVTTLFLLSCSDKSTDPKVLRFGIIPFENAEELLKNVTPMLNVMSKGLGMEVKPFIAADYTGVIEAFRSKKLDAAFLTPASYVMGKKEANIKVILKSQRNGNPYYYGVIIARKDSGINKLQDLKGKKFSFGDPLSTSGHVFPRMLMLENKINPDTDFEHLIYSGAHDATVFAVLNKKVDAGATFTDDKLGKMGSWRRYLKPEEAELLKIVAITNEIPADNICVSEDMDPQIADKLAEVIINYGKTNEGQKMMKKLYKFDGYLRATDSDYDSVRKAFEISGIKIKENLAKKKKG